MTPKLPDPLTDRLARSPLRLVVCQVRHESIPEASQPTTGAIMREKLKGVFPILEQQLVQELAIAITPGGGASPANAEQRGWKLRASGRSSHASVMPDFYSLETTRYEDWPGFRHRLEMLTQAVASTVRPSLEQRVGIRFVDRIAHPEVISAHDWLRLINPAFLGPIAHPQLGDAVRNSQQLFQMDMGDETSVIVRHGAVSDPESGDRSIYLLDIDCFVHRGTAFAADGVLESIEHLHTISLQVFQHAITPELYAYLKGD